MNKKHIVFIEASLTGAGQKAAEYAKSENYLLSFFTKNPSSYPKDFLSCFDNICCCNTNLIDELLVQVIALDRTMQINGITTTSDFYVPQASFCSNMLNLPAMLYSSACKARNKYFMRSSLEKNYAEVNPQFTLAYDIVEAGEFAKKVGYPIIAKPQNTNDSLHVKKIYSDQELEKYILDSTQWKKEKIDIHIADGVLLESFIAGEEFSVETMQSYGGDIQLVGVARKDGFLGTENGNFIELGGSFPVVSSVTNLLFSGVAKALTILKINCGVIHTECRVEDGKVKILEVNPRMVGDMMGSHVINFATGINLASMVVKIALGANAIWKPIKNNGAAMIAIHASKDGILKYIDVSKAKNMRGIKHISILVKPGTAVCAPRSNADLLGYIISEGEDADQARRYAYDAYKTCRVILD